MQDEDIWLEDEDVVQDLMAFQDEDPGFEIPYEEPVEESHSESLVSGIILFLVTFSCFE